MVLFFEGWYKKHKSELNPNLIYSKRNAKFDFRFMAYFTNFMPLEGFDSDRNYYYYDTMVVFLYTDKKLNEVCDRMYVPYYNNEIVHGADIPDYLYAEIDREIKKTPLLD